MYSYRYRNKKLGQVSRPVGSIGAHADQVSAVGIPTIASRVTPHAHACMHAHSGAGELEFYYLRGSSVVILAYMHEYTYIRVKMGAYQV